MLANFLAQEWGFKSWVQSKTQSFNLVQDTGPDQFSHIDISSLVIFLVSEDRQILNS